MREEPARFLRTNGLPGRLLDWLNSHPDEYLTINDVAAKFDAKFEAARYAVERLEYMGLVTRLSVGGMQARCIACTRYRMPGSTDKSAWNHVAHRHTLIEIRNGIPVASDAQTWAVAR